MFRLNPAFSSGISRNRHVHQLRYHQSALDPIQSQFLIGKLINVPMVFPYFHHLPRVFLHFSTIFPWVFRCFPGLPLRAPRAPPAVRGQAIQKELSSEAIVAWERRMRHAGLTLPVQVQGMSVCGMVCECEKWPSIDVRNGD